MRLKLIYIFMALFLTGASYAVDYRITLGPIDRNDNTRDVITLLKVVTKADTVYLDINSPGGYIHVMVDIINALDTTQARVVCRTQWQVMSAAAIIAFDACLNRHSLVINPLTVFMVHYPYSCSNTACIPKIKSSGKERAEVRRYYKDIMIFLTPKEQDDMFKRDVDVFILGKDVIKRLNRLHRQ